MTVVDLFAGPGGWDVAAQRLGLDPIGIEWDPDACATRHAAGLRTIRADLADYQLPDGQPVEGLIGSPPCPLFSAAGKREGVDWLPHLCEVAAGHTDLSSEAPAEAVLSLKPLEWALRHRPTWIVLEQVPAVDMLWKAVAGRLGAEGWSTWTGVLNAANFGVPQTRQRAILIARRDAPAHPPEPTHAQAPQPSLFGPEAEQWVTMAEALGIDPATTLNQGTAYELPGYPDKRHPVYDISTDRPAPTLNTMVGGQWHLGFPRRNDRDDGAEYRERDWFPADGPAQSITEKARSAQWVLNPGRTESQPNRRNDAASRVWERPDTTIACDPRVAPPGHKDRVNGEPQFGEGTLRLTPTQAAVLQSFPAGYPFQGSNTAKFRQIGNAVPPLLAEHVIRAATS